MDRLPQELVDRICFFVYQDPWDQKGDPDKVDRRMLGGGLPAYHLLSSAFLAAVNYAMRDRIAAWYKSRTFRSDGDDLQKLTDALHRFPKRQTYLRRLTYVIALPQDREDQSREFTDAVQRLFHALAGLPRLSDLELHISPEIPEPWGERLNYYQYTQDRFTDHPYRSYNYVPGYPYTYHGEFRAGKAENLRYWSCLRSRIGLIDPWNLPLLPGVSKLAVSEFISPLLPRVAVDIGSRLPNLRSITVRADARELRFPGLPRRDRHTLAASLSEHLESFQNLTEAAISLEQVTAEDKSVSPNVSPMNSDFDSAYYRPADDMTPMPDLLFPLPYDPLGSAIRQWSQNLRRLHLNGSFDQTLFWPDTSENSPDPYWPNLEEFTVDLPLVAPDGNWYFDPAGTPEYESPPRNPVSDPCDMPSVYYFKSLAAGLEKPGFKYPSREEDRWSMKVDMIRGYETLEELEWKRPRGQSPGYGSPSRRVLRNTPNDKRLQRLFAAWARALTQMPVLLRASINFMVPEEDIPFCYRFRQSSVCYEASGTTPAFPISNVTKGMIDILHGEPRRVILYNMRMKPPSPFFRMIHGSFRDLMYELPADRSPCFKLRDSTWDLLRRVGDPKHKILEFDEREEGPSTFRDMSV
ncbi:hypothetical protein F4778DRAFT_675495 [Xylariomycetidae sp. FL2044]|nr:hypothetical protein F4778DRAFT_675495 [Xylariomycetidae sp. FL2044]